MKSELDFGLIFSSASVSAILILTPRRMNGAERSVTAAEVKSDAIAQ